MRQFVVALAVFASASVFATERHWTGAVNNNWSTPGNWSPAGAPSAGDTLIGDGTMLTMNNDLAPIVLSAVGLNGAYVVSGNAIHVSLFAGSASSTFNVPIIAEGNISVSGTHYAQLSPNGHTMNVASGSIGQITGAGEIIIGSSTQTLSGAHSFSGIVRDGAMTTANAILLDNASLPNATFAIGRGLEGNGQIGPLQANGWVKPGGSAVGAITTGALTFTTTGGVSEEFGEYHVDISVSGHDVLNVTGSVTLNGKPLVVSLLGGYTPGVGKAYVIVNNDGSDPVNGIFTLRDNPFDDSPIALAEGQKFAAAGSAFRISYHGGSGNDVVLTVDSGPITQLTTTSLFVSASTATSGEVISLGAQVSASTTPSDGTVTFRDGAATIATVPLVNGGASTTKIFSPGSHSITARYNGSATHDMSTSSPSVIFMKTPTSISATATHNSGGVSIDATVASTIGPAIPNGSVIARVGNTVLGSTTLNGSGRASLQVATAAPSITVDYLGNATFTGSTTSANVAEGPHPSLSISDVQASENDGSIVATVRLGSDEAQSVSVDYATSNGTAIAGEDYDAMSGTLTFAPGQSTRTISINLRPDANLEEDETFTLTLSHALGAEIIRSTATLTILNDDDPFQLHRDLQYGLAQQLLDLRVPDGVGPFPLVVVVDAVRWSESNQHSSLANFLPERGYAVATIGLRPLTAGLFPTQFDDLKTALDWLRDHATQYQLDPQRVAVLGNGRAGGHLAALAAVTDSPALGIDAAIVGRAATDFVAIDTNNCDAKNDVIAFLGCTPSACVNTANDASPITHASPGDAPFLIVQTTGDCGQSQALASALRASNVDTLVRNAPTIDSAIDWTSNSLREDVAQFLAAKLRVQGRGRTRAVRH